MQSGSDRILAAMKRPYRVDRFLDRVHRLRAVRPDISLSSDFIIGFPGETDEDFQDTLTLVEEVGFDTSFSFVYSPRPGTPAAELDEAVSLADPAWDPSQMGTEEDSRNYIKNLGRLTELV